LIYLDSSCLVKLFRLEPESAAVVEAVGRETSVVVSILAELETLIHLKAAFLGGELSRPRWRQLEAHLALLRNRPPYDFRPLAPVVFQTAIRQHRNSGQTHCRSVDRLHLAAMETLELTRLMTHDERQAKAALTAGFEVVRPGRPEQA
jgi:predicted nucleic acid-binding protein